jgi:hypothetical protein
MTLAIYLAGSIVGVGLMVALCYALFGARTVAIAADNAVARLACDVAGFQAGAIALSADGSSALVEDRRDGAIHLVVRRGDALVTRRLGKDLLNGAAIAHARLDLRLADFTLAEASLILPDPVTAQQWQQRLERAA